MTKNAKNAETRHHRLRTATSFPRASSARARTLKCIFYRLRARVSMFVCTLDSLKKTYASASCSRARALFSHTHKHTRALLTERSLNESNASFFVDFKYLFAVLYAKNLQDV